MTSLELCFKFFSEVTGVTSLEFCFEFLRGDWGDLGGILF